MPLKPGRWLIALWLAPGLAGAAAAAQAKPVPEFTAAIVKRDAAGATVGTDARLYVSSRKVRIETPEAAAGFFLIDEADTALFVQPARQVFMDARRSSRLTQIFVPVDPKDPCPQWLAAAKSAGGPVTSGNWHCERMDSASAGDHGTIAYLVAYLVISSDQPPSQRWIDPVLAFPVKARAADGTTITLEHVRVEPQLATLFALPPGYRKLDPQALIDRIKHSDVWVDSPQ